MEVTERRDGVPEKAAFKLRSEGCGVGQVKNILD